MEEVAFKATVNLRNEIGSNFEWLLIKELSHTYIYIYSAYLTGDVTANETDRADTFLNT